MGTKRMWIDPRGDDAPSPFRLAEGLDTAATDLARQMRDGLPDADLPMLSPTVPEGAAARLRRLDPRAVVALCGRELASLVVLDADKRSLHLALRGGPALTLAPPSVEALRDAVGLVRSAAALRAARRSEIVAQNEGFGPFLEAVVDLAPSRRPWTRLLLASAHTAVSGVEMAAKLHAGLPRPIDFAPDILPILPTPAHPTWPAGHATEAFAAATLIAALRLGGDDPAGRLLDRLRRGPDPLEAALLRMAARIAENRTAAGLHFPVDNAHGALMGFVMGLGFARALAGGAAALPSWAPGAWTGEFSYEAWLALVGRAADADAAGEGGDAPDSPASALWGLAAAEWAGEGAGPAAPHGALTQD